MKIVADQDIPFIRHYLANTDVTFKPGRLIEQADLKHADVLIVRSVTPVNAALLQQTPVKFVGTVTTGVDHLDTAWLEQAGIQWWAAKGYNAIPVADYVLAVLALLPQQERRRVGVVGVGAIGSLVEKRVKAIGGEVLVCDPLRAEKETEFRSQSLGEWHDVDVITLHVPLTQAGPYATHHLVDETFLKRFKNGTVLINTSRGEVIDVAAFKMNQEKWRAALDVWHHEPCLDLDVLKNSWIGTPHMAGYSVQCRYRGVAMMAQALGERGILTAIPQALSPPPKKRLNFSGQRLSWAQVILSIFNPQLVSDATKTVLLKEPEKCATLFDSIRQQYINDAISRHEFNAIEISDVRLDEYDYYCLTQLGININD